MKSQKLIDAIGYIGEDVIENATKPIIKKKKSLKKWLIPVSAAVLALIISAGLFFSPDKTPVDIAAKATVIAKAQYPEMAKYPAGKESDEGFYDALLEWSEKNYEHHQKYKEKVDISEFLKQSIPEFLSGAGDENLVYSPLNVYMALCMLAETTGGESRAQILDLLGVSSIEALREQANYLWNANYCDDGAYTSILASSLWMRNDMQYKEQALKKLAENYYASSFKGEMGSQEYNAALQSWLNEQTGGLLKDQISNIKTYPETVMALATTVYFNAKWDGFFSEHKTKQKVFNSKNGEIICDFMNRSSHSDFYSGEGFSAYKQDFERGGGMWFILPDEDIASEELLKSEQMLEFICSDGKKGADSRKAMVNLSLPKFDVTSQINLNNGLNRLGVTDIFSFDKADFTPIIEETNAAVSEILHGSRVQIDEEGCTAAAYTVILKAGSAYLPEPEEIDFVLDRPFVFVVTSPNGLPLFTGIVNTPV